MDSYPFHPDLLDLMYHRWGSLPSYQRTRGALQFLASVIYDLWEHGRDLQPLIGVGDIPFDRHNTRNAFFSQVGQRENYSSVMDADLTGTNARSQRIDRAIAADSPALQRYRVGTRLASSVMLYSFGARDGEERGVPEADLIQANAVPGLDRMSLTTALNDLRNELLYLHYTGRRYRFETQPNLNKLIDDETKKYKPEDITNHIGKQLEKALDGATGAVIWPDQSGRVNDRIPMLQIVYMPTNWSREGEEELFDELNKWLEYAGSTRREFKNALAFALPSYMAVDSASSAAREELAINSLIRDKARFKFNNEQLTELKTRARDANDRLVRSVLNLYERVTIPVPEDRMYSWSSIQLQNRNEPSLHARIMGALTDSRLVFDSVTPDKIIILARLSDEEFIAIADLVVGFFSYLSFTRLDTVEAITKAISRGVAEGKFGYTVVYDVDGDKVSFPNKELIYFNRSVRTDEIDLNDGLIIEAKTARDLVYVEPVQPQTPETTEDGSFNDGNGLPPRTPNKAEDEELTVDSKSNKIYRLRAVVDKSKIFKLFRIIQNLVSSSDQIRVELDVVAEKDEAFDKVWIRNAVEEPLDESDIDAHTLLE